jgi:hypothetical protein
LTTSGKVRQFYKAVELAGGDVWQELARKREAAAEGEMGYGCAQTASKETKRRKL